MSQPIRKLHTQWDDSLLKTALNCFGLTEPCTPLPGYENHVYLCQHNQKQAVLRIGHCEHRTVEMVQAEVAWLEHLHQGGAPVVCPIPSLHGQKVACFSVNAHDYFVATALSYAPGALISLRQAEAKTIQSLGHATALLHRLSRTFKAPLDVKFRRPTWEADHLAILSRITTRGLLREGDALVIKRLKELMRAIRAKSHSQEDYGLIHGDLHDNNFHVFNHQVTLFDFDDAVYGHYAYDLAVTLVETFPYTLQDTTEVHAFVRTWLEGYQQVAPYPVSWLKDIDLFITARILSSLLFMRQNADGTEAAWETAHYAYCHQLAHSKQLIGFGIPEAIKSTQFR